MIVTNPHLQRRLLFIGFMCQNIGSYSFYVPYLFILIGCLWLRDGILLSAVSHCKCSVLSLMASTGRLKNVL